MLDNSVIYSVLNEIISSNNGLMQQQKMLLREGDVDYRQFPNVICWTILSYIQAGLV